MFISCFWILNQLTQKRVLFRCGYSLLSFVLFVTKCLYSESISRVNPNSKDFLGSFYCILEHNMDE